MMNFLRTVRRWCAGPRRRDRTTPALEELEARAVPAVMQPLDRVLGPLGGPTPTGGTGGYTPTQIRHAYGFDRISLAGGTAADGSGQTIAIVTAYGDSHLVGDLAAFDTRFNLPTPALTVVAQDGSSQLPPDDPGWTQETALDVEWAHAIAPGARLLVVETNSADEADCLAGIDYAAGQSGVNIVSLSFGEPEYPAELQTDSHFQHAGVVFVAAAGDAGTVTYPAASPYVLAVGGTSLALDGPGNRLSETAWGQGGGGLSQYEPAPAFQPWLTKRGAPDVAYDADPGTGFAVYNSGGDGGSGWVAMGGTSAGAPQWAGLLAIANQGRAAAGQAPLNGSQVPALLYSLPASDFYDITAGGNAHNHAGPGFDLVTGRGSPVADRIVADLAGSGSGSGGGSGTGTQPPPSSGALHGFGSNFSEVAGTPFVNLLAIVTDPFLSASPGSLTATISWGDGRVTSGTVIPVVYGAFGVIGSGTYSSPGTYTYTLTVTDTNTHESTTVTGTVTVQPDPAAPTDPPLDPPPNAVLGLPDSGAQGRRPGKHAGRDHPRHHHAPAPHKARRHHGQG
jgi:subtilase family serine protease